MVGPTKVKPAFCKALLIALASSVTAGTSLRPLKWLTLGAPPTNDQSHSAGLSTARQACALRRAALSLRRLRMMPASSISSSIRASLICDNFSGSKPCITSR
ncbi:hypothetical protein D3C71_1645210 [compost metagenome]